MFSGELKKVAEVEDKEKDEAQASMATTKIKKKKIAKKKRNKTKNPKKGLKKLGETAEVLVKRQRVENPRNKAVR
jgi:hypothetical protein